MQAARGWQDEARAQLRLALPVIAIQLGLVAMGAVDGAFLGRIDAVQYAASAIGHAYTFLFLSFGMGFLSVLDPVVSQAFGARDQEAIARALKRGLVLACIVSVPISLVQLFVEDHLRWADQKPEVIEVAAPYTHVLILSVVPFLLFVALRQTLQALHRLRPVLLTILAANLLNVALDWMWIDGHLGFPALGAMGSAWATVVSRWFMALVLIAFAGSELWGAFRRPVTRVLAGAPLWRMTKLGVPVGIQWFGEVGAFAALTAMMGSLGKNELAANQVAMHIASASFMVPLGISMAAAVRVGNEIGAGRPESARLAARVAIQLGVGVMICFAILFVSQPEPLARLFTDIDEVLAVAVVLLPLAGMFQVFDGIQGVVVGVLRGIADTRVPMLIHLTGFWVVGFPIAWLLGFTWERGATGLWIGMSAGLAFVACAQSLRLRALLGRRLDRVVID